MPLPPQTEHRIAATVTQAQRAGRAPSLIVGVVRDGGLIHSYAAGADPVPDPDTQYRLGSITKTMTAVLVMRLRDAGRLDLDDPLETHLPGTPVGRVTPRHLLSHTSGLQREPDGDWWERSTGTDLGTLLAGLTPDKLAYPAQRGRHYSNLAYALLGAVVERITGQGWWDAVRETLLTPLGMTRTTYQAQEPFARGYVVHPWHETLREEPRTDTGAMAPAGQLWSTLTDLARWAAFLIDPVPAILSADTLREMCAPAVMTDIDTWTAGSGLGLQLARVGERVVVGHGGSMPGYVAALGVHRPSDTGVVGFANSFGLRTGSIAQVAQEVLTTVLDDAPRPEPAWRPAPARPEPAIAQLCGRWWWMGSEHEARWDAEAGELVVTQLRQGEPPWRFAPAGEDRWRGLSGFTDGEILTVRRDADGRVRALDIATFLFTRDPDDLG